MVWVIPLLESDDRVANAAIAPGTGTNEPLGVHPPVQGNLAAVLTLYGYEIAAGDADQLLEALTDAGTHASLEAAAALRWGRAMDATVDDLEPELCRAIRDVLVRATPDLAPLHDALSRAAAPTPRTTRLVRRIHNPRRRACGCLDDCWCRSTVWGRVVRWYIPQHRHSSVSPCWKQTRHEPGRGAT